MEEETPKRVNSFVIYSREQRKELCERYPDLNNSQITSLLAHNWKKLDEKTKGEYKKRAEIERVSNVTIFSDFFLILLKNNYNRMKYKQIELNPMENYLFSFKINKET